MSPASRTLNRVLLFVLGVAAALVAVAAAWPVVAGEPWPWLVGAVDAVTAWARSITPDTTWIVVGAAIVLALLTILGAVWIATRRRRRTSAAIAADGIVIDGSIVEDLLRRALATAPDITGVSVAVHHRRRERLIAARVQVRPRADVVAAVAEISAATETVDRVLGVEVPTIVHVTTGIRSLFARQRRVD